MPDRSPTLPVLIALLLAAFAPAAAGAQAPAPQSANGTGGRAAAAVAAPDGLSAVRVGQPHLPARRSPRAAASAVRRSVTVRRAAAPATDPRVAEQWALVQSGAMGAPAAWRQTTGGDVTVAIVDSGADLGHPDLAPNLWTNPGEVPGNGVDDDGNGYVDDVHGYDFVDADGDPQDANGHGTHVAGIVAARGGNGIGVSGVAWRARLMVVRVLDADARGLTSTVADGIRYAVANGARIVNLSLAGNDRTADVEDAVNYALANGVLVVAAAGNDGRDLASAPTYPAGLEEENVIGVAATTPAGGLAGVSDYGPGADLAAPGQDILSTAVGRAYEWRTGTSMAAPQVTGALVLLAAARPDLDWRGLRDAVLAGARRTGLPVAYGSLDVAQALRRVVPAGAWRTAAKPKAKTARAAKAAPRSRAKSRAATSRR